MSNAEPQLKIEVKNITQERDMLQLKCEQAEEAYAQLLSAFKQMQRQIFGQRSERYIDPNDHSKAYVFLSKPKITAMLSRKKITMIKTM
jgi:hypothetical protein